MDLAEQIGLQIIERSSNANNMLDDDETVISTFDNVKLIISSDSDQGLGKLLITESKILWINADGAKRGYAADFIAISMHAIANDPETSPTPYLYVQLDTEGEAYGQDGDDEVLPELQLIPADATQLEAIFQAFCDGAIRNPDEDAEEEGQGNLFFDQDEALAGATLEALDVADLVGEDPDRFDDPPEQDGGYENGN